MSVLAIRRDASGYRTHRQTVYSNPETFHLPKWHVAVALPLGPSGVQYYMTACGRPADENSAEGDLSKVPADRRCQRPGCRQRWPAGDEGEEGRQ